MHLVPWAGTRPSHLPPDRASARRKWVDPGLLHPAAEPRLMKSGTNEWPWTKRHIVTGIDVQGFGTLMNNPWKTFRSPFRTEVHGAYRRERGPSMSPVPSVRVLPTTPSLRVSMETFGT